LTPDSMTVRLKLKRIRVVEVVTDVTEQLEVVVADLRSVVTCPSCGLKTSKVHDTRRVKIKDLPVLGAKTTLIWLRRRFSCDNCGGRHLEDHPAFEGKMTRRLARALVTDARHLSITEITRRYGFSWSTVMTLISTWSERVAAHRRSQRCRVLLIDETSLRRRHRYVTVVVNAESGEALGVVEHRNAKALRGFLAKQGHRGLKGVEVVVTDGSEAYRAAIHTHLSHASHVVDRFHAVRWFADGLVEVRRRIQRVGDKGERPAFDPSIFRSRYLQLTRRDHLSDAQYVHLIGVISQDPELWHAWRLVQMLYGVYEAATEADAARRIEEFVHKWAELPVPEFKSVLQVLVKWLPEILAFHRCSRITNGRLEGQNNKLGVLKRIAYGFTNADNFGARALLWCPPVTS
jgi:transposase